MTEFEDAVARTQATALVNRHLISLLFEEVFKGDPEADAKIRSMAERLVAFFDDAPNAVFSGNAVDLIDTFFSTLRQRRGAQQA